MCPMRPQEKTPHLHTWSCCPSDPHRSQCAGGSQGLQTSPTSSTVRSWARTLLLCLRSPHRATLAIPVGPRAQPSRAQRTRVWTCLPGAQAQDNRNDGAWVRTLGSGGVPQEGEKGAPGGPATASHASQMNRNSFTNMLSCTDLPPRKECVACRKIAVSCWDGFEDAPWIGGFHAAERRLESTLPVGTELRNKREIMK